MIRHLVLFKLNEGVTADDPRVAAGVETFTGLGTVIPGVESWLFVRGLTERAGAYDYVIDSTFADADALLRYREHPAHQEALKPWEEFASWAVADFEF